MGMMGMMGGEQKSQALRRHLFATRGTLSEQTTDLDQTANLIVLTSWTNTHWMCHCLSFFHGGESNLSTNIARELDGFIHVHTKHKQISGGVPKVPGVRRPQYHHRCCWQDGYRPHLATGGKWRELLKTRWENSENHGFYHSKLGGASAHVP